MAQLVRHLLLFTSTLFFSCEAQENIEPPYPKYVNEIVNSFVREMHKEYGLYCEGSGGSMPKKVHKISVRFLAFRRASLEEAREMVVTAKKKLVEQVNAHKKIRPYLAKYPFPWEGADIAIAFCKRGGGRYLDGSIAFVCQGKGGKICYSTAELQKVKSLDFIDFDGTFIPGKIEEEEVLVDLLDEPLEEALNIVHESRARNDTGRYHF